MRGGVRKAANWKEHRERKREREKKKPMYRGRLKKERGHYGKQVTDKRVEGMKIKGK